MAWPKIYIDESGHSGRHPLADPTQPIHVAAAVWLSEEELRHFNEITPKLRKQFAREEGELKGSRLLKNNAGKKLVASILSEMAMRQIPVTVIAMHKAFMAATILVEDTTDYVFNPRFPVVWTNPIPEKLALTSAITQAMPRDMMSSYLRARKSRDFEAFHDAATRILKALEIGLPEHERPLSLMPSTDFRRVLESASQSPIDYSVNLGALRWLLNHADRQAAELRLECDIVHDEQLEFEDEFEFLANALRSANVQQEPPPFGVRLPTANLRSFGFEKSVDSLGLQLADCLAAAALQTIQRPDKRIQGALHRLLERGGGGHFTYVFGTKDWQMRALVALVGREFLDNIG